MIMEYMEDDEIEIELLRQCFKQHGAISVPFIQRKLKKNYSEAARLYTEFVKCDDELHEQIVT